MIKFVPNILEIVPGTLADYRQLAEYHYRTEEIRPFTQIHKVKARQPYTKSFPDPVAVVVYRMPVSELRARSKVTNGFFSEPKTRAGRLSLINQKVRYLCRLIVQPQFRKLGIGTKLVTETLPLQQVPIVETLTPIDFTNALFEKCGFEIHYLSAMPWYSRFTTALRNIGLADWNYLLPETLQNRLDNLDSSQSAYMENEIKQFIHHFGRKAALPPGIERTEFILSKIPYPQTYALWLNPALPLTS